MRRPVLPALSAATARLTASRRARILVTIAVAALLFAGVAALRLAVDVEGDPEGPLFLIPIALIALVMGRNAGLVAGVIALALFLAQHEEHEYDLTAWTVGSRAAVFLLLGGLLGNYVERARRVGGEVRKAESGYRDLLGRLPAIVYTSEYGVDGEFLYVSPGIEPILGYSVEEWMADQDLWLTRMHPGDVDQALAAEERSQATGEPLYSEYRLFARDGRVVWFRDEAAVITDDDGHPMLMAGMMLDITSQRSAQDELELGYVVQKKLAEATSLTEGVRGVLGAVGARFNWDMAAFWAVDTHDRALRLSDVWHVDPAAGAAFERASRDRRFREGEGLPGRVLGTGEVVWVEDVMSDPSFTRGEAARASGLRTAVAFPAAAGGEIRGVLEFFSREQRPADQEVLALMPSVSGHVAAFVATRGALEENQGRFQAVLDAAPAPVYAKDTEGRYLFVNRRFEEVLNVRADEVVGRTDYEIMPPDVAASVRANDAQVLATGRQIEIEEEVPQGDTPGWYLSVKFPLRDSAGEVYAVCGISSEITELKRAQQELSHREEAERATRAKTEFLSRVSHELRTPLNAILGFGQLLEVEPLCERQHASVDQIMKGGRHLLELVDELLEVSRIESGEFKVSLRPTDVAAAVEDILHLLQPLAAERHVSIANSAVSGCTWALADEQRTKQVLLNLLSNAIKYNRSGGGVDVSIADPGTGYVSVRITDTGRGIAPEDLDRLFSPFDRLGAEQSAIEGTGLGLALSKLMVEAMNGRLGVESMVDVGSTFVLELPLAQPAAPEQPVTAGKALSATGRSGA
jgi:two-component system sensor histidine kinase/response regulator